MTKKELEQYDAVLSYMKSDVEYKLSDISEIQGVKETRTKSIIKGLIEAGKIETIGSTKAKRYIKVNR